MKDSELNSIGRKKFQQKALNLTMLSEAFHENHFKLTKPKLSSLFKPSSEEKERRKKSVSASATIAIVCKGENEPKNTFCRSKNWITVDRFRPDQPNIAIDVGNLM